MSGGVVLEPRRPIAACAQEHVGCVVGTGRRARGGVHPGQPVAHGVETVALGLAVAIVHVGQAVQVPAGWSPGTV